MKTASDIVKESASSQGAGLFGAVWESVRDGAIYGMGQILSKGLAFVLVPLYTNRLTPSDYGVLALLMTTSSIGSSLFQLGLGSAFFRSYYDYPGDEAGQSKLLSTTFYILLISCLLFILVSYFVAGHLSELLFSTGEYDTLLRLIMLSAGFSTLQSLFLNVYRARKEAVKYSLFQVVFLGLRLALNIYFVAWAGKGLWGIVVSECITSVVSTVVLLIAIRKQIALSFSLREARILLSYGLPLVPHNLAGYVLSSSSLYFLRFFSSAEEVGLYSLGSRFGSLVQVLLLYPLAMSWSPMMLSVKDEDYAGEYYSKVLTYFLGLGILLVLGISLLSREVIVLMTDQAYWAAYTVVPMISLGYLWYGAQRILSVGMTLKRKTEYSAIVFVGAAGLSVILNFALVPPLGMVGAALSMMVIYLAISVAKYFVSRPLYEVRYEWGRIAKLLGCAAGIYFLASGLDVGNLWMNMLIKTAIVLSLPFVLIPIDFYQGAEKRGVVRLATAARTKIRTAVG
jgi:O-antigen/teichoic acid export membrane protein